MTPEEFKAWRKWIAWSQTTAAEKLGISRGSVELYERGARREDDRPVTIPATIELACFAAAALEPAWAMPESGSVLDQWIERMVGAKDALRKLKEKPA